MKTDDKQQNSKSRLCGERDETVNQIISKFNKVTQQEYNTKDDWAGKVIRG